MPRSTKKIIALIIVALSSLVGGAVIWLAHDEDPLNYSDLMVNQWPNDPQINGYSAMRHYWEATPFDEATSYQARNEVPTSQWDMDLIQSELAQAQPLFDAMDEAFELEIFKSDKEGQLQDLSTEVSGLRIYKEYRILEIRCSEADGKYDLALEQLLDSRSQAMRMIQSESELIGLLTGMSWLSSLNSEATHLLASSEIDPKLLFQAANSYQSYNTIDEAMAAAFRKEFQFMSNCLILIQSNPEEILDFADSEPSKGAQRIIQALGPLLYKENRTRNYIYEVCLEAVEATTLPANQRTFPKSDYFENALSTGTDTGWRTRNVLGKILLLTLCPASQPVFDRITAIRAQEAATALSFAIKAYYQDHNELPPSLENLTPTYINQLPLDPFDNAPMRYSQEKAIIYSIGSDFTDNGGSSLPFAYQFDTWDPDHAERDTTEPTFPLLFTQ